LVAVIRLWQEGGFKMNNFIFCNPVKIVFGKGTIAQLPQLIPNRTKLLFIYGGGSIKRNGVYNQVIRALNGRLVLEFGGIEPNPRYETCMKALALGKKEGVEFFKHTAMWSSRRFLLEPS
jgi:NADP-dependent alcohol dehydrogenase